MDRAALDVAAEAGLACGGWCPKGRRAEDGPIPARYPLTQTATSAYPRRTEWNVRDSDGTLVLYRGAPRGGTALTLRLARRLRKPLLALDLGSRPDPEVARRWIRTAGIRTLNVAGPRESEAPGIGAEATAFLRALFAQGAPAPTIR